jgi:signal transduction protein with GAF and PtsI domain
MNPGGRAEAAGGRGSARAAAPGRTVSEPPPDRFDTTLALYRELGELALERPDRERAELTLQRAAFANLMREGVTEPTARAFGERFAAARSLTEILDDALDGAIAMLGSDCGNIQLLAPRAAGLRIVAHRGCSDEFLDYFAVVDDEGAACGRAMLSSAQVVVPDVERDPAFAAHRHIAASSGFRAVQSTPLVGRRGRTLGVVSTHFGRPHRPTDAELERMTVFARLTAALVELKLERAASRSARSRPSLLQCEDCRTQNGGPGTGWVALHLDLMEAVEPVVLTYCPACARQFDPDDLVWRLDGSAAVA